METDQLVTVVDFPFWRSGGSTEGANQGSDRFA